MKKNFIRRGLLSVTLIGAVFMSQVCVHAAQNTNEKIKNLNTSTIKTLTNTNLPAPENLKLGNRAGDSIQLKWDITANGLGVDHYHIYADVNDGQATTRKEIGSTNGIQTDYGISVDWNKIYTFYVTAVDTNGNESSPSNGYVFSTDIVTPAAPTQLYCNSTTSDSVTLQWAAADAKDAFGIAGYDIYDGSTSISKTKDTDFTITGLTPNSDHAYTVVAYDSAGNYSSKSNIVQVKTSPSAPALHITNRSGLIVELSWNTTSGANRYHIYAKVKSDSGCSLWDVGYFTGNSHVIETEVNKYYSFYIKAVDIYGHESNESNIVNVSTDNIAPEAPTLFSVTGRSGLYVGFTWEMSQGADHYYLYSDITSSDGVTTKGVKMGEVENDNEISAEMTPGNYYTFYVVAVDASGNMSAPSNTHDVTTQ